MEMVSGALAGVRGDKICHKGGAALTNARLLCASPYGGSGMPT